MVIIVIIEFEIITITYNDLYFLKELSNDAKKKHTFFVADLLYAGICVLLVLCAMD